LARDQRRDQLLAVARRLFAGQGYHHVSMDDIAEHANVTKPVLYRHFPSKLDLYLAIVDERSRELLATIDRAVAPAVEGTADDGRDVVAAVVAAYITFVDDAGESSTLLFESDVTHDPDVRARVEHGSREATRRIAEVLGHVTDLPTGQAATAAAALVAMAQGAAIYRMRHDDAPSTAQTSQLVARLAWAGVAGLVGPSPESPGLVGPSGPGGPTRPGEADDEPPRPTA
jgi:AcrR family transcriptional regulator